MCAAAPRGWRARWPRLSPLGARSARVEPRASVDNGTPIGVETARRVHPARHFVASSLNPQQTFLELMTRRRAGDWRAKAANFTYNLLRRYSP